MSVSYSCDCFITDGPHNVHISPLDVVTSGDRVSLECFADSVPTASLTWMFNGSKTGSDSQLIIDKVDHSHAGKYTCTAWNSVTRLTASAEQMLHVTGMSVNRAERKHTDREL